MSSTCSPSHADAGLSSLLAHHVDRTQYEMLPPEAISAAKSLILDTVSTAWAGAEAVGIDSAYHALASAQGYSVANCAPPCRIWGRPAHAPVLDAAFINSASAAALDFDALHLDAVMHSSIMTLPALVAVSQQHQLGGKALLTAIVLADDLNCRLGVSAQGHNGWFFTSVFGIFGTAAASAKLLGCNQAEITHALGIALFQTGGTQQAMLEKSLAKRFMAAFAARNGLFSAMLAKSGITGPTMPFEGKFGLSNLYQECDPDTVLRQLGLRYENCAIHIKKYPCCGCSHAVIEATLSLMKKHNIKADDVASAQVDISEFMNRMIGGEFDQNAKDPQVMAQFNAKYAVACALLRGQFKLEDLDPKRVLDPRIRDITRRVKIKIDPNNHGELAPATLTFGLRSGRAVSERIDSFPGSTCATISRSVLESKADDCFRQGFSPLSKAQIDGLVEKIDNIEAVGNMADFFTEL
ncbi:MmgE/PrpD family protein [Allopusillimonas soli]|uniref:MmgE/PrpD family protein n=1 Tax=Allopusillimonas soli TaxID=659016 RepID=A0A853F7Z1_9BURK|nr:MmgE/PrpD family protein [Allopusillimonas soli]NYT36089.1 MmgE/PrpD family protein [Allopusillimonas soli]TEA76425.1 MmgE/PrpD family protein [Allopusillimonas soli]